MNITIVGAGNIGTQFAVHCAEKGHRVVVFGSKPELVNNELCIVDENDRVVHKGRILYATNNNEKAFKAADIIFVTVPAFCMEQISKDIYPYASSNLKIGLIPGTGGGECAFRKCIEKGATVFGIQRVPSTARLVEYGKSVKAIGYRKQLQLASIPQKAGQECGRIMQDIFGMDVNVLDNYLNITLTPSNSVLHTTRLSVLFNDYASGKIYNEVPYMFETWDDKSSELLIQCDKEVQKICQELYPIDLKNVKSLREHYESYSINEMTKKLSSIRGFKGALAPMVETEHGYVPDLKSRLFVADFSYGLSILIQIGNFLHIEVPYMKKVLNWYHGIMLEKEEFEYKKYGILEKKDLISFYSI
jgi:hypothetical protein